MSDKDTAEFMSEIMTDAEKEKWCRLYNAFQLAHDREKLFAKMRLYAFESTIHTRVAKALCLSGLQT